MPITGRMLNHFLKQSMIESENRAIANIKRLNESAANMNEFSEDGTEMPEPKTIDSMLASRKSTYGDYSNNARITRGIMDLLITGENAEALNAMHKEGLHMIAHKMSRIVNGDPNYHDSWDDIIGYARCVVDRLSNRPVKL